MTERLPRAAGCMPLARRTLLAAAIALPVAARAWMPPRGPGVERLDPALDRFLDPAAPVETLGTGYRWAEGPVWVPGRDWLLFNDVPGNTMWRWREGRGLDAFLRPSGLQGPVPATFNEAGTNGIALDARGRLIAADSGNRALVRIDLATKRRTTLAARFEGRRFNSPNDCVVAPDGAVYFTDPPYGLKDAERSPLRELDFNGLYRWSPDGTVRALDRTLRRPNGVALSPDARTLYVALSDETRPEILAYPLGTDGAAGVPRRFFDFRADMGPDAPGLPDGLKVAADGTLFATGPGGVHVLSPEGRRLGIVRTGRAIANCALGGGWLWMTSHDRLARIRLRRA